MASGLWMLTALLPVARRLGNRRAARFAAWGGAASLLAAALAIPGCFMVVSWPMLLAGMVGAFLALFALGSIDGCSRVHRLLAWCFALVVIAAIATQPAFHVRRVRREADAAMAELLEAVAPPVDPVTMYPGKPPVPEAEDPVAALDPKAIEKDEASLRELKQMLRPCDDSFRLHPPTEDELAAINKWFATHTNLTMAADAMASAPGYRSCLPGPASFAEVMEMAPTPSPFCEPRARDAYRLAQSIYFRARIMLSAGDGAVGPDSVRWLNNLESIFEGEPTLIAFLMADAIRSMNLHLIEERIDLWKEDDLQAFHRLAEDAPAWAEGRTRTALASEFLWAEATFERYLPKVVRLGATAMSGSGALKYWIAFERRAYYRHALFTWMETSRILKADAGIALGEEIRRFRDEECSRGEMLPPLAAALAVNHSTVVLNKLIAWRDRASFIRTAIAVERFRRAHDGVLPTSLDALVPDYLPVVPRSLYTGEPLHYEPGPIEIPEETFPALQNPDEAAAETAEEFQAYFKGAEQVTLQQLVDAINDGYGERDKGKRTLPAQTVPGFSLTLADELGRKNRDRTIQFLLGTRP